MFDHLLEQAEASLAQGDIQVCLPAFYAVWIHAFAPLAEKRRALKGICQAILQQGDPQRAELVQEQGNALLVQLAQARETDRALGGAFMLMPFQRSVLPLNATVH